MRSRRARRVPPVPYGRTAVRPDWADLTGGLRAAIEARLGAPVVEAATAGGGFTRGFAAVLRTAGGDRVFVKAARWADQRHLCDWYAREAALTAALPATVAAPRPRWTLTAAGHFVVCLEAVDGRMPGLPWRRAELDAALRAYAVAAEALREPPARLLSLGLPTLADLARTDLSWWREVAEGRMPLPAGPPYLPERLADLAALEGWLPHLVVTGAVIHGDLRLDNILIDRSAAAWICDWTWVCHGPAWFDLAGLLVTGYASGMDVDTIFTGHPAGRDAPPLGLDAALAALSGYWLTRAASAPTGGSPYARRHHRWSGELALDWLAERRRWA